MSRGIVEIEWIGRNRPFSFFSSIFPGGIGKVLLPGLLRLLPFLFLYFGNPLSLHARMPAGMTHDTPTRYWQFWMFYEEWESADQKEEIVRFLGVPLYSRYRHRERAYEETSVFYPLFVYSHTNYWSRWNVLDLFMEDSVYHEDTGLDSDTWALLFSWGSGDTEKEEYSAFFPFYGHIKDKLGQSEINFIFPYIGWRYKDYRAHSILWLWMWGGSPTRDDLRIFPFYSQKIHYGKYEHYSILWPIIQWGHDDLDKRDPRHYFMVFPFFGRKWSDSGELSVTSILFGLAAWGGDEKLQSYSVRLFWFLYQYDRSEDPYIRRHVIFPFWGKYEFADQDRRFYKEMYFYSPFYISIRSRSTVMETDHDYIGLFLYQDQRTFYRRERETERYIKAWPFFKYREDSFGNMDVSVPALWPFRADRMEQMWLFPFGGWLFEYREFENGYKYLSLFFHTFTRYWNDEEEHIFITGLEVHDTPTWWSAEFAGGLVGVKRQERKGSINGDRETIYRLLWFDI